jgi:ABC-type lipoprotein release transport system permease subunit
MSGFVVDLRIAWHSLLQHGRRTLFLAGAIAAVACMFVLLWALLNGIRQTLVDSATTLITGHINVGGYYKLMPGHAAPVVTDYQEVVQVVRRTVPELEYVVQRGRGWAKIISDHGGMQRGVGGIDVADELEFQRSVTLVSGDIAELAQPNTLLVFEEQARKLQLHVGDTVTVMAQTSRGVTNTLDCRIVAVAHDVGLLSQWNVYVSNDTLRSLYQLRSNVTSVIMVHLRSPDLGQVGKITERLRSALAERGYRMMPADARPFWQKLEGITREDWTGQKLEVSTWQDELSFIMWTLQAVQGFSGLLLLILIAISITGVMNALWVAIRERTREIGTLRAIGMQRGGVLRLFLLEAFLLGLLGAALGVGIGLACATVINQVQLPVPLSMQLFLMRGTLWLLVTPQLLVATVAALACVTSSASLIPALRAARLTPVHAMERFR